ncbi:MAG: radical SAM protein [Candidatus Omnitrophota bacterium]
MSYKNILLISPFYKKSYFYGGKSATPPIGLGCLAEMLSEQGVPVTVVDMGLDHPLEHVLNTIKEKGIDLIGVSLISYSYRAIYAMIDQIKKAFPGIPIIVGGPHMLSFKKKVLEDCSSIDLGAVGQGEEILSDLVKGVGSYDIKGLIYRKDGKIIENPPREPLTDLNVLPFPKYRAFEIDQYSRLIPMMSSRGCPSQCIYCQKTTGERVYYRSADSVASEIRYWYDRGYRQFSFNDENFTLNGKRTHDICEKIIAGGMNNAEFSAQGVRADCVNEAILKHMREAGFVNLSFGVEAGNDRMLKVLKKGVRLEVIDRAVKMALEMSFRVQLYFLVGSPYETLEDVRDSFKFALKHPVYKVIFSSLIPYPGTELYRWVEANGRFYRSPEDYLDAICPCENTPFFEGPGMTYAEKVRALRERHGVTRKIFVNGMKRRIEEKYNVSANLASALAWFLSVKFIYNLVMFSSENKLGSFVRGKLKKARAGRAANV